MAYRRSSARRGRASSTRRSYSGARRGTARKTTRRSTRKTARSSGGRQTLRIVIEHAGANEAARPAGIGTVTKSSKKSKF